jgi:hypothetical protein
VQGNTTVDCSGGGPIDTWLRTDLAAHPGKCSLAFWHNARWTTQTAYHGDYTQVAAYMNTFYAAGGDVALAGDNHVYERFAPRNAAGGSDPNGVTEFVVGTGGKYLMPFTATPPSTGAHIASHFGVLKLTLHPASFDYQFIDTAGSMLDSGAQACH